MKTDSGGVVRERRDMPIAFEDIRPGDSVVRERALGEAFETFELPVADRNETHVIGPQGLILLDFEECRWFLVDRPTPPVELPTEPTLGWLSWRVESANNEGCDIDFWSGWGSGRGAALRGINGSDLDRETHLYRSTVTAFTPATAVPTAALDELRSYHDNLGSCSVGCATGRFLAAIDATGATQ